MTMVVWGLSVALICASIDLVRSDSSESEDSSAIELWASCKNAGDGYHWLKLMEEDSYPAIHQKCDNGYMVIDYNEDPNVQHYFSTFMSWHYALSGPSAMDPSNWQQWWLPSNDFLESNKDTEEYFRFVISPDCSTCDTDNNFKNNDFHLFNDDDSVDGDRTAYYMTGTLFGCLSKYKALKDCRWDYDSYQCTYCTRRATDEDMGYHVLNRSDDNDWTLWTDYYVQRERTVGGSWIDLQISLCGVYPQAANSDMVPKTRDECNSFQDNVQPSIGNDGRFCVCVAPHSSFDGSTKHSLSDHKFAGFQEEYDLQHSRVAEPDEGGVYELYQSDFLNGTYRIKQSGTYVIMEDIVFDFGAGDLTDPNNGAGWWPQGDNYPGAGTTKEEYYLGFIAGITVEVDDVVIDLNEHEIGMGHALYYQQRFFAVISLKSVAFPLNQGPGFFGFDPKYPSNVVIKNGVIGLSSHHGIHGHFNNDVLIENVHIHSFETHGVEMSYFNNLTMRNVEIGPSSNIAFLKGEYGYARWTVQALERIQESDYNDVFPVRFSGREEAVSFDDVIETLRDLMDIAFKTVMKIEEYDDDDEDYQTARALFINDDGIPYGAVMYGLFLNLYVANVFTIHPSTKHATNAFIENVVIHDLEHKTLEYIRFDKWDEAMYRNQFNGPLDASWLLGDQTVTGDNAMPWADVEYRGSPLTDASVLLSLVTNDWGEQALMFIPEDFQQWALGNNLWNNTANTSHPHLGCNNDRMSHVPKGVIGIRMDGANDVHFNGLEISNLREQSPLGSWQCGEYWAEEFTRFHGYGNTLQNAPYLMGYTGNYAHGIFSDWSRFTLDGQIEIKGIQSDTGLVHGIALYTHCEMMFAANATISISRLSAGHELYGIDTTPFQAPYNPAVAKPMHILWDYFVDGSWFSTSVTGVPRSLSFSCIYGRDGSDASEFTMSIDNTNCEGTIAEAVVASRSADSVRWTANSAFLLFAAAVVIMAALSMCVSVKRKEAQGPSENAPLLQREA